MSTYQTLTATATQWVNASKQLQDLQTAAVSAVSAPLGKLVPGFARRLIDRLPSGADTVDAYFDGVTVVVERQHDWARALVAAAAPACGTTSSAADSPVEPGQ